MCIRGRSMVASPTITRVQYCANRPYVCTVCNRRVPDYVTSPLHTFVFSFTQTLTEYRACLQLCYPFLLPVTHGGAPLTQHNFLMSLFWVGISLEAERESMWGAAAKAGKCPKPALLLLRVTAPCEWQPLLLCKSSSKWSHPANQPCFNASILFRKAWELLTVVRF